MCFSPLSLQFEPRVHIKSMIPFSHMFYTDTRPLIWAELLPTYNPLTQVLHFFRILSKLSYSSRIPCLKTNIMPWNTYLNTSKKLYFLKFERYIYICFPQAAELQGTSLQNCGPWTPNWQSQEKSSLCQ